MAARGLGKGLDALIPSGINEKKTHSESNSVQKKIDEKSSKSKDILKGNIKIKNLSFSYPGIIDKVLEDINIEVKNICLMHIQNKE